MEYGYSLNVFTAFSLTALLILLLRPVAFQINLLDQPNHRKQHNGAIPLIGGLAMFLAFSFTALTLDMPLHDLRGLFAGLMILVVVGVLDDLHELSARARFGAQIVAALIMVVWGGIQLSGFGALLYPGSDLNLGWMSFPATVFATVGVINALNMIDGVNGLAGSVSLIAVCSLVLLSVLAGNNQVTMILGLLAGVLAAFLLFNLRYAPGKTPLVFMGDAGSMCLGFALAWFVVDMSQGDNRTMSPVTALWILAVPLIDAVTMMTRRIIKGQSPFSADREHFHHLLQSAGFTDGQTVKIILATSLLCAGFGVFGHLYAIPEAVMFYLFLTQFALFFWMIMRAWKLKRFLKRTVTHSA